MNKKHTSAIAITGIILLTSLIALTIFLTRNEILKANFIGLDTENLPTLRLQGTGTIYASPDEAEILLSVVTENEDSEIALAENNTKMNNVINYLKSEGVENENIKTGDISIIPLEDWREDPQTKRTVREIYAYRARNTVEIKLKELDRAGEIINGAVKSGANEVSRFNLVVSNEDEYKKKAREEAIKEAREKGEEIASALGVKIKRVISFSEDHGHYFMSRMEMDTMEGVKEISEEVPLEPGENKIEINVTVEYEIR